MKTAFRIWKQNWKLSGHCRVETAIKHINNYGMEHLPLPSILKQTPTHKAVCIKIDQFHDYLSYFTGEVYLFFIMANKHCNMF